MNVRNAILTLCLAILCSVVAPLAAQESPQITVTVLDENGQPLSDVEALLHYAAKGERLTDTKGVVVTPRNNGLLIVRKEGYCYNGLNLDSVKGKTATIKLRRHGQAGRKLTAQPITFTVEQRNTLFDSMASDCEQLLQDHPNDQRLTIQTLQLLAQLNPTKALSRLEEKPMPPPMQAVVKQTAVAALAKTDPETAIEIADGIEEPMFRAGVLRQLLDNLPMGGEYRTAAEEQYLETIQSIPQPQLRLAMMASMAERYQLSGRHDKAKQIVDKYLEDAKKLPSAGWSAFPRSLFAALIVNDDFEAATKLIEGVDKASENTRAVGRLAFCCCRQHPEQAIRLLESLEFPERSINTGRIHVKVAHRMAIEHPAAAAKAANLIEEPNQRAWALGMVAHRLSSKDPTQAKAILAAAVDVLNQKESRSVGHFSAASTMAGLLRVVEVVDPDALDSLTWNAAWLAVPQSRWATANQSNLARLQNAAAAIARYDRGIASALNQRNPADGLDEKAAMYQVVFDCGQIADLLDKADAANGFPRNKRAREKVITLLGSDATDFLATVSEPQFMQWPTERYEEH